MAVQVTGTYGTGIGPTYTWVLKKTLEYAHPKMPLHTFAQKRNIPLNSGKTARFTRLMHLAPVTSAGTEGAALTTIKPYAMHFDVTVKEWENAIAVSSLLDDTFITPALEAYLEILGINMGESMQLELQKTLWGEDYDETTKTYEADVGCIGLIGDASQLGTNNATFTADSTGTTTTFVSTALNNATPGNVNDSYLGGSIVFTNPQSVNYGLGRRVFDSTSSSATLTWKTVVKVKTGTRDDTNLVTDLETARVCAFGSAAGQGGAALSLTKGTDILTASLVRHAVAIARKYMASPIRGADFVLITGPESYHDIGSGTGSGEFIDIHKYGGPADALFSGEVGRIAGARVVLDHKPYRLAITTPYDYSASGGLHVSFLLGRDALGACGLQGQNTLGDSDTQVIIKRPGPQTTSDPTNKFSTAGWKTTFARLSIDATNAVGIVTYPNAL